MGFYLRVNTNEIRRVANNIENLSNEYKNDYLKLLNEIRFISAWKGKDSEVFKTKILGFEDDFEKMQSILCSYGNLLNEAATEYERIQQILITQARRL